MNARKAKRLRRFAKATATPSVLAELAGPDTGSRVEWQGERKVYKGLKEASHKEDPLLLWPERANRGTETLRDGSLRLEGK